MEQVDDNYPGKREKFYVKKFYHFFFCCKFDKHERVELIIGRNYKLIIHYKRMRERESHSELQKN